MTAAVPPTPYERLGGEAAVRKLVDRFYDLMSQLPEAAHVLRMHPADLAGSRDKFFEFLSGWLGGPQLYMERRGHPRLRMRHMHFPIDNAARDGWLLCMNEALEQCVDDVELREMLRGSFSRLGDHLRNVGEQARPEDKG